MRSTRNARIAGALLAPVLAISGVLARAGAASADTRRPGGHHTAETTAAPAPLPAMLTPPKRYYLALGDSLAYGFQPDKALAGLPPQAFNTGYVDLFAARLTGVQLP